MSAMRETFTIGVEEEYQVVDPVTRHLSALAPAIFAQAQPILKEQVQQEIRLSQIEATTSVCETLSEVRAQLQWIRQELACAADHLGQCIVAAGTHPFSHWSEQPLTPLERYHMLADMYQQFTREMVIFGCHVHIGLRDREMAVQVMNRARYWLAPLLALSANSPFWLGADTGYASYRATIFERWPVSGFPGHFASLAEYEQVTHALINLGCVPDAHALYWDIRLSDRHPTIELRVTDTCLSIDEAVLIAGLARAIIHTCYHQVLTHQPCPSIRPEILRVAHWHAARFGISSTLIDIYEQRPIPTELYLHNMLSQLRPALEEFGDWQEINQLLTHTLRNGNGALKQRQVYQQSQQFEDVVDMLIMA